MRLLLLASLGISAVITFACGHPRPIAVSPQCPLATRAAWTPDSLVALCVPADFVAGGHGWGRPGVGTAFLDLISIQTLIWPRDSAAVDGWPPHIASSANCAADCGRVDRVVVYHDAIAGSKAQLEVGLASGGFQGWHKQPFMIAGWIVNDSLRVYAYAWARRPATIDSLRMLLGYVRVAPVSS